MPLLDQLSISDYQGIIPYQAKQQNVEGLEQFYIYIFRDNEFTATKGKKIEYKGITGFISSNCVYEAKSGQVLARLAHGKTIEQSFYDVIDQHGINKVESLIDNAVNKYGLSPLYQPQTASV
jgi:hypothetical protein